MHVTLRQQRVFGLPARLQQGGEMAPGHEVIAEHRAPVQNMGCYGRLERPTNPALQGFDAKTSVDDTRSRSGGRHPGVSVATAAPPAISIVDVSVVDAQNGRTVPEQTVVIRGGRIDRVGPSRTTALPAGITHCRRAKEVPDSSTLGYARPPALS